jgi:hypothetical protein
MCTLEQSEYVSVRVYKLSSLQTMYEGLTRLLIVFLTHPGVLVPIPVTGVIYLWVRGLWQATWVLILHGFSEGGWKQIAELTYWMLLVVMVYIQVAIAMAQIKT